MLRQVDVWKQAGMMPRESLLWALVFGDYHEHLAAEFVRQGDRLSGALAHATVDHLLSMESRVQIPKAVAHEAAHIMGVQPFFDRTGGRQPERLQARHYFRDAFVYFKFSAVIKARNKELLAWWKEHTARG